MARQRQVLKSDKPKEKSLQCQQKSDKNPKFSKEKLTQCEPKSKSIIMISAKKIIVMFIVAVAAYIAGKGYLETRVNTPFDEHRVCFLVFYCKVNIALFR